MKATFISKEKNDVKFTMEFSADEFEAAVVKAYQATKDKFEIDGFRRGKAPRKIIETRYGEGIFYEEAVNTMFDEAYAPAIDELKLKIVDRPRLEFSEIKKGETFTITVTVEVYPEFEVKNYKGVEVEKQVKKVAKEDVENELKSLQLRNARLEVVDRAAKMDDSVVLDYCGSVDGVEFEGGAAEMYTLVLGSGSFIPGFEEQLVGTKAGETKDVVVTFPTEYHAPELAGKEAVFKCLVHEVKHQVMDELNDDFAKDVSEFDTLKELKDDLKKKLEKNAEDYAMADAKNQAVAKVLEDNKFDIPQAFIDDEIDQTIRRFEQQLQYQGMNLEGYLKYAGGTMEEFRKELLPQAENAVKTRMLVTKIAEQENVEVSEADVEERLKWMADQYKLDPAKLKEVIGEDGLEMVKDDCRVNKGADIIFNNIKFKEAKKAAAKKADAKAEEKPAKKTAEKKPAAKKTTKKEDK